MTRIVELGAAHLDEGEFMKDLDRELSIVVRSFCEHARNYPNSGLAAKLKCEIVIEENDAGVAVITTGFKKDLPGKPKRKSTAMFDFNDLEEPSLFCKSSGADDGDPAQRGMFDPDEVDDDES